MDLFVRVCGEEARRSAAEALGLVCSYFFSASRFGIPAVVFHECAPAISLFLIAILLNKFWGTFDHHMHMLLYSTNYFENASFLIYVTKFSNMQVEIEGRKLDSN